MPKDAKKPPTRRKARMIGDARLLEQAAQAESKIPHLLGGGGMPFVLDGRLTTVAGACRRRVLAFRRGARALREKARSWNFARCYAEKPPCREDALREQARRKP